MKKYAIICTPMKSRLPLLLNEGGKDAPLSSVKQLLTAAQTLYIFLATFNAETTARATIKGCGAFSFKKSFHRSLRVGKIKHFRAPSLAFERGLI